jgi:hypothetical protein
MHLRAELTFRKHPGGVAVLAHNHWNGEPSRQEQGLITEIGSAACGIYQRYSPGFAPVSSRQDVEGNATIFQ